MSDTWNFKFSCNPCKKKGKKEAGKINFSNTHYLTHIKNISTSNLNRKISEFISHSSFPIKSLKSGLYFIYIYSMPQFGLATFKVLNSYILLVAAVLDSAGQQSLLLSWLLGVLASHSQLVLKYLEKFLYVHFTFILMSLPISFLLLIKPFHVLTSL